MSAIEPYCIFYFTFSHPEGTLDQPAIIGSSRSDLISHHNISVLLYAPNVWRLFTNCVTSESQECISFSLSFFIVTLSSCSPFSFRSVLIQSCLRSTMLAFLTILAHNMFLSSPEYCISRQLIFSCIVNGQRATPRKVLIDHAATLSRCAQRLKQTTTICYMKQHATVT